MSGWRHAGEWDPSAVDYELEDTAVAEHIALLQSAKATLKELTDKLQLLSGVSELGAETSEESAETERKAAALRLRRRDQELRAAYLEVKLKDRLAIGK